MPKFPINKLLPANTRKIYSCCSKLILGILLTVVWSYVVLADSAISKAEIYRIYNQVEVQHQQQPTWKPAKQGDTIIPQEAVRTGANSRADLLFNEGTLVRTGAGTIFRFPPGKRSFELTSGAALVIIRPDRGESIIETPEAKVVSHGTALFIQRDRDLNASLVGVLTNSPLGLVEVFNRDRKVSLQLQAGQFVSIVNGVMGLVENFVLPMFYETIELSSGLGMTGVESIDREPLEVQKTLNAVREETLKPLQNQLAWLDGFCSFKPDSDEISPLLQLLGWGVPGAQVSIKVPPADLFVLPFRSASGLVWLKDYCQNQNSSASPPQDR
jgi:hypothetical protein